MYKKIWDRHSLLIIILMFCIIGLVVRYFFWREIGSLTWDEGAHSLAGIGTARYLFDFNQLKEFMSKYWAATGSFFFYPWGYTLFTTISYWLFGITDFSARLPNYVFAILYIPGMYLLGKELFNQKVGLWSAFLAIFTPWIILWSRNALTDVPLTTLTVLTFGFLIKMMKSEQFIFAVVAGICLGLAGQMKPTALVVYPFLAIIPIGYWLYKNRRIYRKQTICVFISCLITAIIAGSYLFLGYVAPKFGGFGEHISNNILHWIQIGGIYAEPGDPTWRQLHAWRYYIDLLPNQVGRITLYFAVIGLVAMVLKKVNKFKIGVFIAVPIFIYLIFVFVPNKDGRYTMQIVPFITIYAAYSLNFVSSFKHRWLKFGLYFTLITLMFKQGQEAYYSTWMGYSKVSIEAAAQELTASRDGGLVVVFGENNGFNVQNVSFYIAANDPHLEYGVYWVDRVSEAKWAVSQNEINIDGFDLWNIVVDTNLGQKVYIYKRI